MKNRVFALAVVLILTLTIVPVAPAWAVEADVTEVFIDFEDGTLGGFEPGGIGVSLTITDEVSHTGNYSLFVSEMQEPWYTPRLQVAQYIIPDTWYEATFWVKIKTPEPTALNLWTQMMPLNSAQDFMGVYPYQRYHAPRSSSEGWIEIRYVFYYDSSLYDLSSVEIFIHTDNATDEFYIDNVSFRIADLDRNIRDTARLPSLWETYQEYFMFGNITDEYPFHPHKGTIDFYRRHFNIIKPMSSLGWTRGFMPEKWVFDFTAADKELGIWHPDEFTLVFPFLIYRMHNAEWLTRNPDGTLLTRAEAIANMERYINTISAHYESRFDIWVIVNEPRSNLWNESGFWIDGDGHLASWYLAFDNGADRSRGESGGDYVEYAFRFARAADPNRKLYLSDQAEWHPTVANNVADLVGGINSRWLAEGNERLLIEGIVMQGHYFLNTSLEDIERTLSLFASLGVSVSIGELDIPLFRTHGTVDVGVLTQELLEQQAEMYARLFLLFKEYADVIDYVMFWGVMDDTSWLNEISPDGTKVGRPAYPQYPLLFDNDFAPKLAYFAVIDPEGYLAGDFDTPEKIAAWLEANMLPEVVLEDDTVTDNEPDAPAPPPTATPPATPPSDSPSQEENNAVTQDAGTEDGGNTVLWVVLGAVGVVGVVVVVVLVVKKKR